MPVIPGPAAETDSDDDVLPLSDDECLNGTKILRCCVIAATVYGSLAVVGIGLGYLIEMALGWLP